MKYIQLTRGMKAIVDDKDYIYYNKWKWNAQNCSGKYYAARSTQQNNKKRCILLHREITNAEKGKEVDHINRNTLDNRRTNLRVCSKSDNGHNRPANKNNQSGIKGLCYLSNTKRKKKWLVQIYKDKRIFIGYFLTQDEAKTAYNKAAIKYFNSFAYINQV